MADSNTDPASSLPTGGTSGETPHPSPGDVPARQPSQPDAQDHDLPKMAPFVVDPSTLDDASLDTGPLPEETPTTSEEVQKVEHAIRRLREKMAAVAIEFAEGKINQAQFEAIYRRYQDQRAITESLLARDPTSDAWKHVLSEGPTTYLRVQHEARLESYILIMDRTSKSILTHGEIKGDRAVLSEAVKRLRASKQSGLRSASLPGERWLIYVPGRWTTAIVIYTNQPTSHQLQMVGDLHRDFETANQRNLTSEQFSPASLVFPQRALFSKGL